MSHRPEDLFTPEEHRILSAWFDVHPPGSSRHLSIRAALDAIDARAHIEGPVDDPAASAVAHILQGAPDRWLPRWQASYGPGLSTPVEAAISESPSRDQALRPQHLLTASWRSGHNGNPASISYYLTWVPGYDRYVVSRAVSDTRQTGDTALGYFGIDVPLLEGLRELLLADWAQLADDGVARWSAIRSTGQLTFRIIDSWADLVWPAAGNVAGTPDWEALHGQSAHARAMGAHGVVPG